MCRTPLASTAICGWMPPPGTRTVVTGAGRSSRLAAWPGHTTTDSTSTAPTEPKIICCVNSLLFILSSCLLLIDNDRLGIHYIARRWPQALRDHAHRWAARPEAVASRRRQQHAQREVRHAPLWPIAGAPQNESFNPNCRILGPVTVDWI